MCWLPDWAFVVTRKASKRERGSLGQGIRKRSNGTGVSEDVVERCGAGELISARGTGREKGEKGMCWESWNRCSAPTGGWQATA